jgi:hypothetical protein
MSEKNNLSKYNDLRALSMAGALTADEVRGLLFRHVVSDHASPVNESVTSAILDLYEEICDRDQVKSEAMYAHQEANDLMKFHYTKSYADTLGLTHLNADDFWVWPSSIPTDCEIPEEICIFLGTAIGIRVGKEVLRFTGGIQTTDLSLN